MRELILKLTLLEDVIVNERPATEGAHASLDYLPGVLLLGAAAARLYAKLSRPEAWQLFHSGQVQFGDALPLVDGQPGWPLPLCWHDKKGDSAIGKVDRHGKCDSDAKKGYACICPAKVRNLQFGRFEDNAQPKQLRAGYVRADGQYLSVDRSFRMKTALDPDSGRIAEAQLFGYESINAGQTFVARIRASAEVDAALWDKLGAALTESKELLLGRSRSAEYGRTEIWSDSVVLEPTTAPAQSNQMTLWCLSDVALLDENGQPTLEPTPAALGLARGEIDWDNSFLRFRRYAIWNAHRNGYDLERQVIQHGSVIALQLDSPLTETERQHLAAGIGLHREAGLGWVSVNPALLATAQPKFVDAFPVQKPSMPNKPDHPLIKWLEDGQTDAQTCRVNEELVRKYRDALDERYRLARAYAGVPAHLPIGPSKAQWGSVYEKARMLGSNEFAALNTALFIGENAICKEKGENWSDSFRDEVGVRNFFDWFKTTVDTLASVQTLRLFAREAMRVADRQHNRSQENY